MKLNHLFWSTFKFTDFFFSSVSSDLLLSPSSQFFSSVITLSNSRLSIWFFFNHGLPQLPGRSLRSRACGGGVRVGVWGAPFGCHPPHGRFFCGAWRGHRTCCLLPAATLPRPPRAWGDRLGFSMPHACAAVPRPWEPWPLLSPWVSTGFVEWMFLPVAPLQILADALTASLGERFCRAPHIWLLKWAYASV